MHASLLIVSEGSSVLFYCLRMKTYDSFNTSIVFCTTSAFIKWIYLHINKVMQSEKGERSDLFGCGNIIRVELSGVRVELERS